MPIKNENDGIPEYKYLHRKQEFKNLPKRPDVLAREKWEAE